MAVRLRRPTKADLHRAVGYCLRLYVATLVVLGGYSLLWLLEIAGYLDERTLATIWLAVVGMGAAFLLVVVPLFYASRSTQR